MTRQEVTRLFVIIQKHYGNFIPNDEAKVEQMLADWQTAFSLEGYKDCEWAVQRHIAMREEATTERPPEIQDIFYWLGKRVMLEEEMSDEEEVSK